MNQRTEQNQPSLMLISFQSLHLSYKETKEKEKKVKGEKKKEEEKEKEKVERPKLPVKVKLVLSKAAFLSTYMRRLAPIQQ